MLIYWRHKTKSTCSWTNSSNILTMGHYLLQKGAPKTNGQSFQVLFEWRLCGRLNLWTNTASGEKMLVYHAFLLVDDWNIVNITFFLEWCLMRNCVMGIWNVATRTKLAIASCYPLTDGKKSLLPRTEIHSILLVKIGDSHDGLW